MRQVTEVIRMETNSEDVAGIARYCGYCRFFGGCDTNYEDDACWEFMADEFWAGNGTTG